MSNKSKLITLLKAVLDSPNLNERGDAVVVSGKTWRRIAEELAAVQMSHSG